MLYAEEAWAGHPCKHVADWEDHQRVKRINSQRDGHAKRYWRKKFQN